jgi:hypothetical protein
LWRFSFDLSSQFPFLFFAHNGCGYSASRFLLLLHSTLYFFLNYTKACSLDTFSIKPTLSLVQAVKRPQLTNPLNLANFTNRRSSLSPPPSPQRRFTIQSTRIQHSLFYTGLAHCIDTSFRPKADKTSCKKKSVFLLALPNF